MCVPYDITTSAPPAVTTHRFQILLALAGRDLHGAGIVRDVLDRTGGEVRLWPATLYGTLDDLGDEALIRELEGDERPEDASERRRYYRITARGREALAEETERLAELVGVARKRLGRT